MLYKLIQNVGSMIISSRDVVSQSLIWNHVTSHCHWFDFMIANFITEKNVIKSDNEYNKFIGIFLKQDCWQILACLVLWSTNLLHSWQWEHDSINVWAVKWNNFDNIKIYQLLLGGFINHSDTSRGKNYLWNSTNVSFTS